MPELLAVANWLARKLKCDIPHKIAFECAMYQFLTTLIARVGWSEATRDHRVITCYKMDVDSHLKAVLILAGIELADSVELGWPESFTIQIDKDNVTLTFFAKIDELSSAYKDAVKQLGIQVHPGAEGMIVQCLYGKDTDPAAQAAPFN